MGWTMDFSGPQMVLTIKLITFAFDYHDGAIPEKV
jgi:lysophospholipid acyltransferase